MYANQRWCTGVNSSFASLSTKVGVEAATPCGGTSSCRTTLGRVAHTEYCDLIVYGDTRAVEQTQPKTRSRPSGQHPVKEPFADAHITSVLQGAGQVATAPTPPTGAPTKPKFAGQPATVGQSASGSGQLPGVEDVEQIVAREMETM